MDDSCAHTPLMYSSAKAEFCAERSSSFCLETDFGLSDAVVLDGDLSSAVVILEDDEVESSDRSIPSIIELDDVVVEVEAAELARFIRNDLQSPNESSSM